MKVCRLSIPESLMDDRLYDEEVSAERDERDCEDQEASARAQRNMELLCRAMMKRRQQRSVEFGE